MHKTTYNYNPFTTIPDDLKALIFEYLPLLDYANLAPVCRDFYYILNNTPDLWAKCLFRDFLDSKLCESDLCDDDFLPEGIAIERAQVKYSEILNSKRLLVNHYNLQKQWKAFFKLFLSNNESYEFVQEVMFGLQCPSYPPPSLKKDVHCFYTNTLFQNFLTEIHFCIQGRSIFQDKKHSIVNNMAHQMEQYLSNHQVDKDHLINVRWYKLNSDQNPVKKLTYHKKNKAIQKRNVASRKCIFKGPSYQKSKILKSPSKKSTPNRSSPIKRNRKFLFNLDMETPNSYEQGANDNYAERFYWMMQDLTENHCKMIFAYLKILQNPYLLLIEYTRLWNKFVLLIIDFTQTFLPFANAFNKFYEKECSELPNFPEFSTWRLMVKIWYEQVYCNLNYYLAEAFRSILMMTRSQEKFAGLKFDHTEKCSFCVKAYETEAGPDCLYSHFFYQFLSKSHSDITRDDVFRVLRDYYQAISDLSYNEYSIFYWDCNTSMKGTPKESLDSYIFQDSNKFYDYCKSCIFHDTDNFKRFFDSDLQIIENVMGQPFALELQKQQVLIVKDLLENIFISAVRNADCCYFPDQQQQQQGEVYNINLSEISKFLSLDQDIYLDLSLNHHKKLLVSSALSKQAKVFSASLFYIAEKQRLMENQIQEFDEIRDHRYLRGFSLTNERYSKFFELGQNPSLKELNQVGMEGKNMKEELESVNDHLIFL